MGEPLVVNTKNLKENVVMYNTSPCGLAGYFRISKIYSLK